MKILVIGAGRTGARVLRQLKKNPELTIITVDPNERPYAVEQGIIEAVDIQEACTPFSIEFMIDKIKPDLVLIATATEDLGLGTAPGMDIFSEALNRELAAIAKAPVIEVARFSS